MNIDFNNDSPCNESGEEMIKVKVVTALWETLEKRTYIVPILHNLPHTDKYEGDDARKCFRAAYVCIESDCSLWREAFEWYKKGHELFCGKQDFVIEYDAHSDVRVEYDFHSSEWQVCIKTWFNTMYGSELKWLHVGNIANEAYIDTSDAALEKRNKEWDSMIAERQAVITDNNNFELDFSYDVVE